jgi:L-cysteine/cystine lyase
MNAAKTLLNIRQAITSRTRLLATSHVTSQAGIRVPGKEICALCREFGILVLLDGAQAVGQFPIDLKAIGCDFYTGNLHKWLLGPKGTGFFYVTQEFLSETSSTMATQTPACGGRMEKVNLLPTWVGAGSGRFDIQKGLAPSLSAQRFEYGTRDFGKYAGISPLLDWFETLGWGNVEEQLRELSTFLKLELKRNPRIRLLTPTQWELASAMTTFALAGVSGNEISRRLWDSHRVLVRTVGEFDAVRISTAVFNTGEEVELLLRLIREL